MWKLRRWWREFQYARGWKVRPKPVSLRDMVEQMKATQTAMMENIYKRTWLPVIDTPEQPARSQPPVESSTPAQPQ